MSVCTREGLMLNSHPQLFCSLQSTNSQPPKGRDRLVREEDKRIKMFLRGRGSSLNTSNTQKNRENTTVTSTQRLLMWWAERPAASPRLSPSWISCDNELNTVFDPVQLSACCERPGIPCFAGITTSILRNPCGLGRRRQTRLKTDYTGLKKSFTAVSLTGVLPPRHRHLELLCL